ncbi:MAG: type II toxin-antitoxin system VapC family toxin [Gaiellaceae bacterium]
MVNALVVDASAVADYLLRGVRSRPVRLAFRSREATLNVPGLCDVEIVGMLRRLLLTTRIDETRAREMLSEYLALDLRRHAHRPLLARMLSLRDNFSAYDASYVALAERLGARLLTADQRLARAVRRHAAVELA